MKFAIIMMLCCATLAACETKKTPEQLRSEMISGPLAFIKDGTTTRETALLELGTPAADFENQRILTFRLGYHPTLGFKAYPRDRDVSSNEAQWTGLSCSLVMVFDSRGVLQKHSIVPLGQQQTPISNSTH